MKIKEKTYYKTRGGQKAYVAATIPYSIECDPWSRAVGIKPEEFNCTVLSWYLDGSYHSEKVESELDLIAEWREPITISLWANVYHNNTHTYHDSREAADEAATSDRLACVCISGTEQAD